MFIIDVNARSLSMEESEFQKHMESARLATQISVASPSSSQGLPTYARAHKEETDLAGLLTNTVNLFEAVCLSMDLHFSFQFTYLFILAIKYNVFFSCGLVQEPFYLKTSIKMV
jgi:hypothetical protein